MHLTPFFIHSDTVQPLNKDNSVLFSGLSEIILKRDSRPDPIIQSSTVLQGTVDLIPMYPLFRGSTVLQGTVDLIPMCPLFRGSTVLQGQ